MQDVLRILTQQSGQILALVILGLIALGLINAYILVKLNRIQGRWSSLLKGSHGENLETVLYEHLREKMRLENELRTAAERIATLEQKISSSKRHFGLVRHDAFEDVGGSQSFALAMYDDHGNGAVLSGIVGRSDARVYCKPLVNGTSERHLSQEEQRAIRDARSEAPKSIVSH